MLPGDTREEPQESLKSHSRPKTLSWLTLGGEEEGDGVCGGGKVQCCDRAYTQCFLICYLGQPTNVWVCMSLCLCVFVWV